MSTRHRGSWVLVDAALFCCMLSSGVPAGRCADAPAPPADAAVAWVGDGAITAGELRASLAAHPPAGAPDQAAARVRKRLDDLIAFEALYREALRQGVDRIPDLRRTIRELLVQRFLDEQVNRPAQSRPVTDEEVGAYYEAHRSEFVRPEQVRLGDIYLAVPQGADATVREERRAAAAKILEEARAASREPSGFSELVRKRSDTNPLYPLGDTGFFDREGKPQGLPAALVEAGMSLSATGEVLDRLVEAPEGFHVIMRTGRRAAENRPLEQVRHEIEGRIRRDERLRAQDDLVRRLRGETPPKIDEAALGALIDQLQPQPVRMQGPPPLPGSGPP